jgi:hypothetical protein
VDKPNAFEFEVTIKELKSHKSPGIDQIRTGLIKAGADQFDMRPINLLF